MFEWREDKSNYQTIDQSSASKKVKNSVDVHVMSFQHGYRVNLQPVELSVWKVKHHYNIFSS